MPPLQALARAGVLEYARTPTGPALRASPRFLAHAEQTAARQGIWAPRQALEAALAQWDEAAALDARAGAAFLEEFLAARHQLGRLQPVFPVLEQFPAMA